MTAWLWTIQILRPLLATMVTMTVMTATMSCLNHWPTDPIRTCQLESQIEEYVSANGLLFSILNDDLSAQIQAACSNSGTLFGESVHLIASAKITL